VPLGQRETITIYGTDYNTPDRTCIRDYVHIEDLASAHVLALEALGEGRARMTYNLGNGRGYSVRQVIDVARAVTNSDFSATESERRPGDAAMLIASSEAINQDLGWEPRYPDLKDIVGSAWAWHTAYPNGYEDN
jgi:UDP-glucose 4-epimerase